MTTTTSPRGMRSLPDLIAQFDDAIKDLGERVSTFFEDLRVEATRRVQDEAAAKPFEDMTVRELHELASEREIPGRSSMDKAGLIEALRKH